MAIINHLINPRFIRRPPILFHTFYRRFSVNSDYDVIVIGGGSGGIACARECSKLGAKVALFDYVRPSPRGTEWGLGGTCVNVGCIPKKLMHYSALLGAQMSSASALGWNINMERLSHDWNRMVETVQNHIKSLNFGYRVDLMKNKINFVNSYASFVSENTVQYKNGNGETKEMTAKKIVIAVGGRPKYPNIPNAVELGLTSDDIFSLEKSPGKTLVVGASYIALETAGFLTELGYDVSVAIRSIALRGFDRQCADKIVEYMEKNGTKILNKTVPTGLYRENDRINVKMIKKDEKGKETLFEEKFDTVFFAIGREIQYKELNLNSAGVHTTNNGKIKTINEQTSNANIYAIGDAIDAPELTPVAIQAGTLLARRIMGASTEQMNYNFVPTTVFTPLEYGCVGLSEEKATDIHGKKNLNVFLTSYNSLESAATHRTTKNGDDFGNTAFAKLICLRTENNRVIGYHYVGENAGEITGGFAVAIKLGATKKDFDMTVGIHPTTAEAFTTLKVTKSSDDSYEASGC